MPGRGVRGAACLSMVALLPACDLAFRLDHVGPTSDAARIADGARPGAITLIAHAEGRTATVAADQPYLDVPLTIDAAAGDAVIVLVGAYFCNPSTVAFADGSNDLTLVQDAAMAVGTNYAAYAGRLAQAATTPTLRVTASATTMCELSVEVMLYRGLDLGAGIVTGGVTTSAPPDITIGGIAPPPHDPLRPALYLATLVSNANGLPSVERPWNMIGWPATERAFVPTAVAELVTDAAPPTAKFKLPEAMAASVLVMALQ